MKTATRKDGLTERQAEVVRAIYRLTCMDCRPPTMKAVRLALGLVASENSLSSHLESLRTKGWILPPEIIKEGAITTTGRTSPGGNAESRSSTRLAGLRMKRTPFGMLPEFETVEGTSEWTLTPQANRLMDLVLLGK